MIVLFLLIVATLLQWAMALVGKSGEHGHRQDQCDSTTYDTPSVYHDPDLLLDTRYTQLLFAISAISASRT